MQNTTSKSAAFGNSAPNGKTGAGEAHRTKRLVRGAPTGIEKDSMVRSADLTKEQKFRVGDLVKIKGKTWYGHKKTWIVEYVFKNNDLRLRNAKNEDELIERYEPKELEKIPEETEKKHGFTVTKAEIFNKEVFNEILSDSSANRAPSVLPPSSRALNAAAPTAANTAEEGTRADYKFCSKKSILDQLETSISKLSDILKISCNDPNIRGRLKEIKITLKHAAKWIKMNSFSSPSGIGNISDKRLSLQRGGENN